MTRRDNITRWRAKDLWTGSSRELPASALPSAGGLVRKDHYRRKDEHAALAAYKSYGLGRSWRRSRLNSRLKPYWGKPAVRNFRGGGGNPKL